MSVDHLGIVGLWTFAAGGTIGVGYVLTNTVMEYGVPGLVVTLIASGVVLMLLSVLFEEPAREYPPRHS